MKTSAWPAEFPVPSRSLSFVHFNSTCIDCDMLQCSDNVKDMEVIFTGKTHNTRCLPQLSIFNINMQHTDQVMSKQKRSVVVSSTNPSNKAARRTFIKSLRIIISCTSRVWCTFEHKDYNQKSGLRKPDLFLSILRYVNHFFPPRKISKERVKPVEEDSHYLN